MREIKFRVFDWEKIRYDITGYECNSIWEISWVFLNWDYYGIERDKLKIMQYTWLKDKNGKEIYEGDVIVESWEFADTNTKYEAVFNERLARFWFYNHFLKWFVTNFSVERLLDYEIIWNIYENKELITNNNK